MASDAVKRGTRHVQAWRRSGLTRAVYCERHGLNIHTLGYWCQRMREAKAVESDTCFVPLQMKGAAPIEKDGVLELQWPSGMQARIAAGLDAQWVATVLGAIRC